MRKSVMNQVEWIALFESGYMPEVFVNVSNCKARILALKGGEYVDVTEEIADGERLAEEAVYDFGSGINISGWYPPTRRLLMP